MVAWCGIGNSSQGRVQSLSNQIAPLTIVIDYAREGWDEVIPFAKDPPGDNRGKGRIDWNRRQIKQ